VKEKQFFFEKKNQKTFTPFREASEPSDEPVAVSNRQKFFVSFFQKRNASFLSPAITAA
jgi:hypothetical protein